MSVLVEVDEAQLAEAKRSTRIEEESELVSRGLALLCEQNATDSFVPKRVNFDAVFEALEAFPELTEEDAEAWKADLSKPRGAKW